jgi:RNA polymerase sigma factor (sigma-70 family)
MDENAIIDKIKQNSDLNYCLKYLYKTYYTYLESYVLKNKGTKEDAEDVVQEVFLNFIQIIQHDKFRGESSLKSFLYSIAKNTWLSKLKKETADHKRAGIWVSVKENEEDDIQEQLKTNEALGIISKVLDSIGPICKNILNKFYYENLSLKEILPFTEFENEQVLRNKKSKCLKTLAENLNLVPNLKEIFYHALKNI